MASAGRKYKQEKRGEKRDFDGLTWMLLIAATPMYRKMP